MVAPRKHLSPAALVIAFLCLLVSTPTNAQQTSEDLPGAFDLLERVRARYRILDSYQDRGEMEIVVAQSDGDQTVRYAFETFGQGRDEFFLSLTDASVGHRIVVWRTPEGSFQFDSHLDQMREVATPLLGLPQLLGIGADSLEAMAVAILLTGADAAGLIPQAASVDGIEPCGRSSCYVVSASDFNGIVESTLWVDRSTSLIARVETSTPSSDELVRAAVASTGRAPEGRGLSPASPATVVHVRHQEREVDSPPSDAYLSFQIPPTTRLVRSWQPVTEASSRPAADRTSGEPDSDVVFRDRVEVRLVTTILRVVDGSGEPVLDLVPADFRVRAGKESIEVVAVDWISPDRPPGHDIPPEIRAKYDIVVEAPGRFVVFFVQADFDPTRISGHLRTLPHALEMLEAFGPEDWLAVVSFDSHLKLRQDFTHNTELIEDALDLGIRHGKALPPAAGRYPSLGRHLDARDAKRAASPERALELVARALEPLPGEKTLVYLGWGLGRFGSSGMQMTPEYDDAHDALAEADVTVFVLDVTSADYHTLEIGLREVAEDTGGTYEKTFRFTGQATAKLARTLSGYYMLTLSLPEIDGRAKKLKIDLVGKKGTILRQDAWVGTPDRPPGS